MSEYFSIFGTYQELLILFHTIDSPIKRNKVQTPKSIDHQHNVSYFFILKRIFFADAGNFPKLREFQEITMMTFKLCCIPRIMAKSR